MNVATGGDLPDGLAAFRRLAWPSVGVLALATVGVAVWRFASQRRADAADQASTDAAGSAVIPPRRPYEAAGAGLVPAQLPAGIDEFVGREREMAELRSRLRGQRRSARSAVVVPIAGKPGIGKSALAICAAQQLAGEFPHGQLYANLRAAGTEAVAPIAVLGQFLRALGIPAAGIPTQLEEATSLYRTLVAGRRVLVVLDDAANEAQVRPLLPGRGGSAVLVTSRRSLTALGGTAPITLDVLDQPRAVMLLAQLAGARRVAADPAAAVAVASHCGGLPLALRIAGAKLAARPHWTVARLADHLADERQRLSRLQQGDQEVRASFNLSYRELPSTDQRIFRRLGLLDGPDVTPQLVAAIDGMTRADSEAALERLVDAQMLEPLTPGRYQLHELLRLFAKERLGGHSRQPMARDRPGAGVLLDTARQATAWLRPTGVQHPPGGSATFGDRAAAIAWLEAERGNLLAAIRQAASQGSPVSWQLTQLLFPFFERRKYWREWVEANNLALGAARQVHDRLAEAHALKDLAAALREQRHLQEAVSHLKQSLAIFRDIGARPR
jgi:DNA polymerase III delta prime subunit